MTEEETKETFSAKFLQIQVSQTILDPILKGWKILRRDSVIPGDVFEAYSYAMGNMAGILFAGSPSYSFSLPRSLADCEAVFKPALDDLVGFPTHSSQE